MRVEGKLTNAEGEFIANGPCEINRDRGEITMWPSWELHMLERERGRLLLTMADGQTFDIHERHLTFKLQGPAEQRISVYRLRIVERVPEHLGTGYVEPQARAQDAPGSNPAPADAERVDLRGG